MRLPVLYRPQRSREPAPRRDVSGTDFPGRQCDDRFVASTPRSGGAFRDSWAARPPHEWRERTTLRRAHLASAIQCRRSQSAWRHTGSRGNGGARAAGVFPRSSADTPADREFSLRGLLEPAPEWVCSVRADSVRLARLSRLSMLDGPRAPDDY